MHDIIYAYDYIVDKKYIFMFNKIYKNKIY